MGPWQEDSGPSPEQKNPLFNRPGLPRLSYRRTLYSDLYSRMVSRLSSQEISDDGATGTRPLRDLSAALPDDPALAILDAWAVIGDVLTFYQERFANEGFLRTAKERLSVLNLSRSIGYELNPGLAATTHLAFYVDDAKGAPGVAEIPAGTRIQSIPGQDELPQIFETMEPFEARSEWNELRLAPQTIHIAEPVELGQTSIKVKGIAASIFPGDAILLVGEERGKQERSEVWEFRIVETATVFAERDYTVLTWERGLGHSENEKTILPPAYPRLFIFRQRDTEHLFGHSAPPWNELSEVTQSHFISGANLPIPVVRCVAISDDGTRGASATSTGTIKFWNVPNGTGKGTVKHSNLSITCISFLPSNATTIVYGASDGIIRLLNIESKELIAKLLTSTPAATTGADRSGITSLDVCEYPVGSGNQRIVAGNEVGQLLFWDLAQLDALGPSDTAPDLLPFHIASGATNEAGASLTPHGGAVTAIRFSPKGERMATGGKDGKVLLWELLPDDGATWGPGTTGGINPTEPTPLPHTDEVTGVVFCQINASADEMAYSSSLDGTILVWNPSNLLGVNAAASPQDHKLPVYQPLTTQSSDRSVVIDNGITCLSVWEDDVQQGLLVGLRDKTIKQLKFDLRPEIDKWRTIRVLAGHSEDIIDIDVTNSQQRVISAAGDRRIKAWDISATVDDSVGTLVTTGVEYDTHDPVEVTSLGKHPFTDEYGNWPQLSAPAAGARVDLKGVVEDVSKNDWVVLAKPKYVELYNIETVEIAELAGFSISEIAGQPTVDRAEITRLNVDTSTHLTWFSPGKTDVYLKGLEYELGSDVQNLITQVQGPTLLLDRLVLGLQKGQRVVIRGKRVRVRVDYRDEELSLADVSGEKSTPLVPGDILVLISAPVVVGEDHTQWHVKDKFGTEGIVLGPAGALTIIPAQDDDKGDKEGSTIEDAGIVSEQGKILDVKRSCDPTQITLEKPLTIVFDPVTVTIHANVAEATHGETNREVLGSGNGAAANQRFKLRKKSMTYIPAVTPTGGESALEVRVNGILWEQVDELDGLSKNDKKYIIRQDDEGFTTIIFGDGINGARLPTGVENVVATYRSGIGFAGNVGIGSLKLIQNKPLGVKSVINFQAPYGSGEPESRDMARTASPKTVLTLDRVVSLKDYESFAMGIPGIEKAQAASFLIGEKWIVHLTVAGSQGETTAPGSGNYDGLINTIKAFRDPMEEVVAESYQLRTFGVKMRILVDSRYETPTVEMAIRLAMQETFSLENRNFGQDVTPSEVTSIFHSVEGVVAADIDDIYWVEMGPSESPPVPVDKLTGVRARLVGGIIEPAELVLIDPAEIHIGEMGSVET